MEEITDAIHQFEIGVDYYNGRNGKKQDRFQAVSWYRKSAEQGYHKAQFSLGYCYHYGKGVTRDFIEAVSWYRKAVEQGDAYAQYNLGVCYNNGEGVPQDKAKAMELWKQSAENGYEVARITLNRLNEIEKVEHEEDNIEQKKYDVFISYSSNDQKITEGVCGFLERNGYRCFVAYRDIPYGVVWAGAIANAIDESKLMVVVCSINFITSPQTDRELELASENKIPILTFRITDTEFSGAKKYYLKNLNWIDAFPNPELYFDKLLKNVSRLLNNNSVLLNKPITQAAYTLEEKSKYDTNWWENYDMVPVRFFKGFNPSILDILICIILLFVSFDFLAVLFIESKSIQPLPVFGIIVTFLVLNLISYYRAKCYIFHNYRRKKKKELLDSDYISNGSYKGRYHVVARNNRTSHCYGLYDKRNAKLLMPFIYNDLKWSTKNKGMLHAVKDGIKMTLDINGNSY